MSETALGSHCSGLARAHSGPVFPCRFRLSAEDFRVDEALAFELAGAGEHVYLQLRKIGMNTDEVAQLIMRLASVTRPTIKKSDVSYAGLKDRNAVATQWFSVYLPGKQQEQLEPVWRNLESETLQVLQVTRHRQKLRRGALKSNTFQIILRDVQGEQRSVEQCLEIIERYGVPNYFGEQRFGHHESNIEKARALLAGNIKVKSKHQRSLYLSAARSLLFNQVLSQRVEQGIWNRAISGDALMLDGSHSFFVTETVDDIIQQRVIDFDIHPTGPLWGKGELSTQSEAKQFELNALTKEEELCEGLQRAGLEQQRRALRLRVQGMQHEWLASGVLQMSFSLESGAYATSLLRECFALKL